MGRYDLTDFEWRVRAIALLACIRLRLRHYEPAA